jgi:hypothetical protein
VVPGGASSRNDSLRAWCDATGVVRAGTVICSVPWFDLAGLFPDPPVDLKPLLAQASRMRASPIVTVNLWLDRRVTDALFVGLPDRIMQWVFDKARILEGHASHLSLVSSGAAAVVGRSNDEIVTLALGDLRAAFPAARDASVRHASVVRERRATFSLAPGQPPRPGAVTPVTGLYLAGDWTDTGLPGTIESAVVSGHRVAEAASVTL